MSKPALMLRAPRSWRCGCVAVAVALLGGCALGPNFQAPAAPAPTSFTRTPLALPVQAAQPIAKQWWRAYQSQAINHLVELALAHNPSIEVALANVQAAQHNVQAQNGLFYPTVQLGYNGSRQNAGAALSSPLSAGTNPYSLHTAQLTVGYTPDIFGANKRQVESLQATVQVQRYQLDALRITIASNVVSAALQEAALREQIRLVHEVIGIDQSQLRQVQGQQRAGYASGMDQASQQAALAQAQALLPPLQKQLEQTRDLLAILCGQLPNEDLQAVQWRAVHTPEALPNSLPSNLVAQRPDVQAALAQAHASNALIGVAVANRLPQFSLTGTLGFVNGALAGLLAAGNKAWGLAAGFTQPLFDGGALAAKKQVAEDEAAGALAQYRATALTAFQNVADALYALDTDGRALHAAQQNEAANEKLLALTQVQFKQGYTSGLNLLQVKQTTLQSQVASIAAQGVYWGDTVALYQALGGGWQLGDVAQ